MTLAKRLEANGPKRILALDGGGIRGAITLGFLERLEELLQARHDRDDMRLCDYFDLIGGTSTGAIIAAGLAIGMKAADLRKMYLELGGKVFGKRKWKKWEAWFDPKPLRKELETVLGDRTLGDPSIETGLCIVTKRADTNSVWPLINHPQGKYYKSNSKFLLREVVQASTAAPVYFIPEVLDVGEGNKAAFVDGCVSLANNPALQLFLVATLNGFPFHWPTGADQLLLVSIGTGTWQAHENAKAVKKRWVNNWAIELPGMFMEDASWHSQLLLQYLSRSPTAKTIDREIGDLRDDLLTPEPALSYLRYDVPLEELELKAMGFADAVPNLDSLREMSAGKNRELLAEIGRKAAEDKDFGVLDTHLPTVFDLK